MDFSRQCCSSPAEEVYRQFRGPEKKNITQGRGYCYDFAVQ